MIRFFLALLFIFLASPASAQSAPDMSAFAQLPVLHDGRIKPLDTLARHYLKSFSGQESVDGLSADQWLAEVLFDPARASERNIFLIRNPGALGITGKKRAMLSYATLSSTLEGREETIAQLLQKSPEEWSADQAALINYHEYGLIMGQLLRSVSFILPLSIEVPQSLAKEWQLTTDAPLMMRDILPYQADLEARLQKLIKAKGEDMVAYSDQEKELALFGFQVAILTQAGENNVLVRVIPAGWLEGEWLSPWQMQQSDQADDTASTLLGAWQGMASAWHDGAADNFQEQSQQAQKLVEDMPDTQLRTGALQAEIWYNKLHPLGLAMALYLVGFILALLTHLKHHRALIIGVLGTLGAAIIIHALAIILRIYILERPPVGTLYESILFVALIAALGALWFEKRQRDGAGLLAGTLAGGALLFVAEAFATDDTMKMLVAVLNTNFWLSTHVLCITIGYGWCVLAALFAHLALLRGAIWNHPLKESVRPVKMLCLIALLFTTIGTILGGIWADQSWGRFWGWDPKENGALLIVLWLAWILHGHLSGHLKTVPFLALAAALNIIVALAWFGVNLLGTGLHSYGFISGVAGSLAAFCAAEILLIAGLGWKAGKP